MINKLIIRTAGVMMISMTLIISIWIINKMSIRMIISRGAMYIRWGDQMRSSLSIKSMKVLITLLSFQVLCYFAACSSSHRAFICFNGLRSSFFLSLSLLLLLWICIITNFKSFHLRCQTSSIWLTIFLRKFWLIFSLFFLLAIW